MLLHDTPRVIDHSVAALAITDGDITIAALLTALGITTIAELVHTRLPSGKKNKLVAEACGVLANNTAKDFAVFAGVFHYAAGDQHTPVAATLTKLGTGTATIGTKTGVAGGTPAATYLFADTMTWTESAYAVDLLAGLQGATAVHSPADNTLAKLVLGEVGFADFVAFESVTGLEWRVSLGA